MARTIFGSEPTTPAIAARNTSRRAVMDNAEASRESKARGLELILQQRQQRILDFELLQQKAPNNLKLQQENIREEQRGFQLLSTE